MHLNFTSYIGITSVVPSDPKNQYPLKCEAIYTTDLGAEEQISLTVWPNEGSEIANPSIEKIYYLEGFLGKTDNGYIVQALRLIEQPDDVTILSPRVCGLGTVVNKENNSLAIQLEPYAAGISKEISVVVEFSSNRYLNFMEKLKKNQVVQFTGILCSCTSESVKLHRGDVCFAKDDKPASPSKSSAKNAWFNKKISASKLIEPVIDNEDATKKKRKH